MTTKNIELLPGFTQVCIWPGIIIEPGKEKDWIDWMEEFFSVKVQYLEQIITLPDRRPEGDIEPGTGGRHDLFFAVHNDNIGKFAIARLEFGIRWIEDVLARCNYKQHIYPLRVFDYMSWNPEE